MNSVNLIGRLGKNPKIGDEKNWASFSLAINHTYRKSDGTLVEQTDWISVVAFKGLVRSVERLGQGDMVGIEGRLRSRVYEKDGERRTAIEVVAGRIDFLRLMERGEDVSPEEGHEYDGPDELDGFD